MINLFIKRISNNCGWAQGTQAVAAIISCLILLFATGYSIREYLKIQDVRRPYVCLENVTIESNYTHRNKYKIYPKLKEKYGIESPDKVPASEELIINMFFKNTGPIAAKDCEIFWRLFPGDTYTTAQKPKQNMNSKVYDYTDFRNELENIARRIQLKYQEEGSISYKAILPNQQLLNHTMLNLKELAETYNVFRHDETNTNPLYLVCKIEYSSIKGKKHNYFCVYKLYHPAAYTRVYWGELLTSEVQ